MTSSQFDVNHWIYRFIALIIDSIIAAIPAYIIYAIVETAIWSPTTVYGFTYSATPWWGGIFLLPLLIGIIQILYFTILDTMWSATIGKRLIGLQVQTVNGSRVEFGKAFIRNISKIHGLLLLLDWILGIITPGADKRQKYTDRIAGTTVASTKQQFASDIPPPPPPPPTQ